MKEIITFALCAFCALPLMAQKSFLLQSPDQKIQVEVTMDQQIRFSLMQEGKKTMQTTLSMTLTDGKVLGANPKSEKCQAPHNERKHSLSFL